MDQHRNFAYGTIITAPSPALTGTSLTVGTGHGARFTAPCNATVWPAGELPLDSNAEIVRITAVVGDVLTIVRQQEGSNGRSVIVGDQIANTITVKVVTDIEDAVSLAEVHASAASAAATSVDTRVNTISQAVSVISQQVSALSSQVSTVDLHAEAASAAATSVDTRVNVISQAVSVISSLVSVISILASVADAHASVASLAATSADGHANTVSIAAAAADSHASIASLAVTSVDGRVTSLHGLSVKSVGGTSVRGLQSVLNALSGRISAASGTGGGGSVTSQEVSVLVETASAAATSADAHANTASAAATSVDTRVNALSQLHSVLSQQVSTLSTQVSLVSVAVTSVDTRLNALSNLHSVLSQQVSALSTQVSVVSVAVGSVDSRVNSVNTTLSGLSVRSVGGVSTHGLQSVLDALSTRISATAAGTGSVASNEVSAVSHNASVNNQSIVTFLSGLSVRSVGNVSTHGLQSVLDALSTRISATAAGTGSVTSDEVSVVSHNASVNNQSIVTFISGVSVRSVGDVSTHGLQSVINALSGRISATSAAISVTSNEMSVRVQVASAAATSADGHANTASAAATSVDGRVTSINTFISGISTRSVSDISTHGLQSVLNALSNRISASGGTGSVTSDEVSVLVQTASAAATSADAHADAASAAATSVDARVNALSQLHSVLSQQVSALSSQVSVVSVAVGSVDARVNSVNTFVSGISARSVGDVSTHGFQSVINALSGHISAASAAATSADAHASAASAAATSVDARVNTLSQLHSVLSQQVSVLSTQVSLVSVAVTSVDTRVNAVSQAHSVLSQQVSVLSVQVSTISIAVTSVDSRVTSVNTFISGISAHSVGAVSTHGLQSIINALSNRISAGGGGGSVTSTEVSAVSHNASVNNQSIVTFLSGISARSALSATVSTHGLQSVVDALSNRISLAAKQISDIISAGGGGVSTTSNELSIALAAVSAQAASALSNAISAGSATASNLLSNINALSNTVSALSTAVSRERMVMVQDIQSISATALLTVSGLSLAISAGEAYNLEAQILYRMSVSNAVGFGLEFPALSASNILIHGQGSVAPAAASSFSLLVVGGMDETGSNSVVFSTVVASGRTYRVEFAGIINCSVAGTLFVKARVSVSSTAVEINRGSFLKLYKLS